MKKDFSNNMPPFKAPKPRSSKIAWLALFFSFLAFLMSGATLLQTWDNGRFAQSTSDFMQGVKNNISSLKNRNASSPPDSAPSAADEAPAASRRPDLATQWDRLREKLGRAEEMVRGRQDGQVRGYLESLKAEMDELAAQSSQNGGRWMEQARTKLKSIREQVATDGPAAARRLHELAGEIKTNIQTLRRVNDALHPCQASPAPNSAADEPASAASGPEANP